MKMKRRGKRLLETLTAPLHESQVATSKIGIVCSGTSTQKGIPFACCSRWVRGDDSSHARTPSGAVKIWGTLSVSVSVLNVAVDAA